LKLLHGDCLDLMCDIPDGSVDMVMADPPYGTTACKWDSVIPLEPMWEQLKRVIKKNGAIVLTALQPFTTTLISSNMGMFKYEWIWDCVCTSGFLNSKKRPLKQHESVLVFTKVKLGNDNYQPQFSTGELRTVTTGSPQANKGAYGKFGKVVKKSTQRYPKTIIQFSNPNGGGKLHPTQKPVALMEYLIKTYTNEGETVLDFCMGSGTTGVACLNLNRRFIGIEKDADYFRIATERIDREQEQPGLFN